MEGLTEEMIRALVMIGFGVRPTRDGFVSEDAPEVRVDMRSAEALRHRGLVASRMGAASGMLVSSLDLTATGWEKFYEIEGEGG